MLVVVGCDVGRMLWLSSSSSSWCWREGERESDKARERREKKKYKATVSVYICTVTVAILHVTIAILHICKVMQTLTNIDAGLFYAILCKFLHILYFTPTSVNALIMGISLVFYCPNPKKLLHWFFLAIFGDGSWELKPGFDSKWQNLVNRGKGFTICEVLSWVCRKTCVIWWIHQ